MTAITVITMITIVADVIEEPANNPYHISCFAYIQ